MELMRYSSKVCGTGLTMRSIAWKAASDGAVAQADVLELLVAELEADGGGGGGEVGGVHGEPVELVAVGGLDVLGGGMVTSASRSASLTSFFLSHSTLNSSKQRSSSSGASS